MRRIPGLLLFIAVIAGRAAAQTALYDPSVVHEVRLSFSEPRWRQILDSLFVTGSDERLIADAIVDGTALADVGVRFKGYSSHAPGRIKNPFNIALDEVHDGQDYQGFKKLKLSNVFQDPSFLREVLSYEVAARYMPASRSAFANLYVNDTLIGLYTSVEDVSKDFLKAYFGSKQGAFFKCNPPTVDLNGENCNLGDSPGTDSTVYYGIYDMQSDQGWTELVQLIERLNDYPESIEELLNVDRALWMHAFNYALINFDSYVGYAQNYYIYRDEWGQWNTIPWDLNMSFAAFRLTDASTYWNGFSATQAMSIDPLAHHSGPSVLPRPLMRNLFANDTWRRMYLAHLRTIMQECLQSQELHGRATELHELIAPHVLADTNKFYSDQGFEDNLASSVSFTITYPGITQLLDGRAAYLTTYPGISTSPVIDEPAHAPAEIVVGGVLSISAAITGADTAMLSYRFSDEGPFLSMAMADDGLHGDGAAGDGVYGALITAEANLIEYHIYAEDETSGAFSPARAAYETHKVLTRLSPGDLVINELMAYNDGLVLDGNGSASDWVELFNASGATISTGGLHLSDDPADPSKWALPVVTLEPGEYLIIWADEGSGDDHASFRLDADGESVTLAYDSATVLDAVSFGPQYPIYTFGRLPNGTGEFQRLPPTFKAFNRIGSGYDLDRALQLWPNPATNDLYGILDQDGSFEVEVFRADGRRVSGPVPYGSRQLIHVDTYPFAAGHYTLRARSGDRTLTQSFIVIP